MHAGFFRVSVILRTLRWTTRSLTCVRDHFYACLYIWGWAHRRVSTTFLTRKNCHNCLCAPDRVRTSVFGSRVRRSTNWATPYRVMCSGICTRNIRLKLRKHEFCDILEVKVTCPIQADRETCLCYQIEDNFSRKCKSVSNLIADGLSPESSV